MRTFVDALLNRKSPATARIYKPSVTIRVQANTYGWAKEVVFPKAVTSIQAVNPWIDTVGEDARACSFSWDEQQQCLRSCANLHALHQGQLHAFEKYIESLCRAMRHYSGNPKVSSVVADVQFTLTRAIRFN